MKNKKIIIWDWDGVIVDSIDYKYDGIWKDVFPGNEAKQQAIADFLETPVGRSVNRYGLIKHALIKTDTAELKDLADDDKMREYPLIKKYGEAYARAVKENIKIFPGAKKKLETLCNDGYHMYVISGGGSDADLKQAAEKFGVAKYFKGIFGFGDPKMPLVSFGKYKNFERVVKLEGTKDPTRYIVVGDGESDYKLAQDVDCDFIAIPTKWNKWRENKTMGKFLVNDLWSTFNSEVQHFR